MVQKMGTRTPFHYGTNEIDNVAAFGKAVGADIMIQVNIADNDPAMWADMVKYTNVEHNYGIKYWNLATNSILILEQT